MLLRRHKKDAVAVKAAVTIPNEDKKDNVEYFRSDISRMAVADLKELAPKLGIEVTEESTGAKLKEQIIEKLAL